ncbi:MAG: formylglycine-generating enzyme family protein [gamma proteobacterium symbiont of Taylorina sp.]|nr:formylglycine-generating enzyme family protein [gamma proteobacterium symbiont of Taylorina sp.]
MKKILQTIIIHILLLSTTAISATHDARYYLNQATKYYNQQDYSRAESNFQQVLKMKVSLHKDFYFFYGKTLFYNEKYQKSVDNLGIYLDTLDHKSAYIAEAKVLLKKSKRKVSQQRSEKKKKKRKKLEISSIPDMIKIPAGTFSMGGSFGTNDQLPVHEVIIDKPFAIGKYQVTFAQFDFFVKETQYRKPDDNAWGRGNRPVINVSYYDASNYARWLSKKTGRKFRLPTEAEWEYVAKTGKEIKKTLGFKNLIGIGDANCDGCRYFWESDQTVPVGSYDGNKYGLHDIFGNVWEWTCSLYTRQYDGREQVCANGDKLEGETMSVRGGGWNSNDRILRYYVRLNNFPTYTGNEQGFRLVEEL